MNKIVIIALFIGALVGIGIALLMTNQNNKNNISAPTKATAQTSITAVRIVPGDSVYTTLSTGEERKIAKFVPFQNDNFNEVRNYESYEISPNGKYVALGGSTFEDKIIEVYALEQDSLQEVIFGQSEGWTTEGLLQVKACNQAGERCTDKISVNATTPWQLRDVSAAAYTPVSYRIFNSLFSFQIPTGATTEPLLDDERITITYVDAASERDTEITDGYFISIDGHKNTTAEAYLRNAGQVSQTQSVEIAGYTGMTYQTESEMGQGQRVEHILFTLKNGTVIDTSYTVAGKNKETYEDQIWKIFASFRFE